ncbi:MAG: GNAT family N-acetyltransferase [Candidatus Limnocylindrales bacterium]
MVASGSSAEGGQLTWTVLTTMAAFEAMAAEWRALADVAARTPFETPDWLLPWACHYGVGRRLVVLTWRRDGQLVGVAPLVLWDERHGGRRVRNVAFWGETRTPLRGWVDVLARASERPAVDAAFRGWLVEAGVAWDVLHILRLPEASSTADTLASTGWARTGLTGVLQSIEFVLDIPSDEGWVGPLGRKARYNIRREARLFETEGGGSFERHADAAAIPEIVGALRRLLALRWAGREAYFRTDPTFEAFISDALRAMFAAGSAEAFVARDATGIVAVVIVTSLNRTTVTLFAASTQDPQYGRYALGKNLFAQALDGAIAARSTIFNFLTEGDYKGDFWGAHGRNLESAIYGRTVTGRAVVAYATIRRRFIPRLIGLMKGRRRTAGAGTEP